MMNEMEKRLLHLCTSFIRSCIIKAKKPVFSHCSFMANASREKWRSLCPSLYMLRQQKLTVKCTSQSSPNKL